MPAEERDALRDVMRERYAVHHSQIGRVGDKETEGAEEGEAEQEPKPKAQSPRSSSKRPEATKQSSEPKDGAASTVFETEITGAGDRAGDDSDDGAGGARKRGDVDTDPSDTW